MAHRVLSHTADTGIEATAETLPLLIAELAAGMFGLIAPLQPSDAARWVETRIESPSLQELVVDTLSELLWLSETEDLVLCDFRIGTTDFPYSATVRAGGVPVSSVHVAGPPVKAVTYHGLVVEQRDSAGWYGRVFLDV